jgi:hypothetical protein
MAKNLEDMVLVSVDDHLIEPPDMFEHHIAPEFKHRAPHIAKGSDGAHHWVVEGKKAPGLGSLDVLVRNLVSNPFRMTRFAKVVSTLMLVLMI